MQREERKKQQNPHDYAKPNDKFDEKTEKQLNTLKPEARVRAHAILSEGKRERQAEGVTRVKVKIRDGERTKKGQDKVNSKNKGWSGMHVYGIAWDVVAVVNHLTAK